MPNNPDSPVAEFDEPVNFPGNGTYKISCQVKNPAGITSDMKDIWVKVAVSGNANIIVHCHNPEGIEINSINGVPLNSVEIYDGDTLIGYGAYDSVTHNAPIVMAPGGHSISVKFNGITSASQDIVLAVNELRTLTFTFIRTEFDIVNWIDSQNIQGEISRDWIMARPFSIITEDNPIMSNQVNIQNIFNGNLTWYSPYIMNDETLLHVLFNYTGSNYQLMLDVIQTFSISSDWYGDTYSQVNIFSAGIVLPIINFPPPRSDFNIWYLQKIIDGYYPGLRLICSTGYRNIVNDSISHPYPYNNQYFCTTISTALNFTEAKVEILWNGMGVDGAGVQFHRNPEDPDNQGTKESHVNYTGTIKNLKFSSIPYDLLGTGI